MGTEGRKGQADGKQNGATSDQSQHGSLLSFLSGGAYGERSVYRGCAATEKDRS